MPVILLERLPLPSLRMYTGFSVVLLACALFYAHQVVSSVTANIPGGYSSAEQDNEPGVEKVHNVSLPHEGYVWDMLFVMTAEAWCVWTLVNTAYCCLILLGKLVQKVVFGDLRVSEQQHLKDKFWNFLFYKFIFVFGVMNVQTMEDVVFWVAWFTVLGFFHLLTQLSKDRFEYVSFSPTTPRTVHIKLLSLLCVIVLSCCGLLVVSVMAGMGITIFAFMAAECVLLAIRTLYVVSRYCLHLIDMNLEGVWENRATYVYYTELIFELAALSIDFGHHLHMLLWGNIFLSMASLVICMQLRYLFYEFQRRIRRHKNYRNVVRNMEQRFSMATAEEIAKNNDDCAVCWERMTSARRLPCGHLFHNSCLRSWLEQDTSCPTCRQSLNDRPTTGPSNNLPADHGDGHTQQAPGTNQTTNHFFHFDGSRYVSWLPSFSVEVTHTSMLSNHRATAAQTSQLDNMARQVLQVFPHMPRSVVMDDLRVTRSVDFTIENILEGRLEAPPPGTMLSRSLDEDSETDDAESHQSPQILAPMEAPKDIDVTVQQPMSELYTQLPSASGDNISIVTDSRNSEIPSHFGGRFSKKADERETMLKDRKNTMLEEARRRFLEKQQTETGTDTSSSYDSLDSLPNTSSDNLRHRRELAYQAAARRLGHSGADT